jgi:acetyl-CoA carboxylase biotin carboxyl carrier protein
MSPEEIKALAQLLQKVPSVKGIEIDDVRRLAELLRDTPELGTIEIKGWFGTGVVITRTQSGGGFVPTMVPMHSQVPMMAAPAQAPAAGGASAEVAKPAAPLKEIKSPMVGTYYAAPEPGAEPYIKVGARVAPGRTVCIIEAMKIMNEIEAEFGGVIREVCVEDAQPVEFGQVLFRVDPNG